MPPPSYRPSKFKFGVRVYPSLEDLLCGGREEELPPGEYPYVDWGRLLDLKHDNPSDGYYYRLNCGPQEGWQWQHILLASETMAPDEIDSDWAYEGLPESFPDDLSPQLMLGETLRAASSFPCWEYLRDAQNPEKFDASQEGSGVWTVRDRGYYLDLDGELPLLDTKDACYFFYELESGKRERCWTYEQLLLGRGISGQG